MVGYVHWKYFVFFDYIFFKGDFPTDVVLAAVAASFHPFLLSEKDGSLVPASYDIVAQFSVFRWPLSVAREPFHMPPSHIEPIYYSI